MWDRKEVLGALQDLRRSYDPTECADTARESQTCGRLEHPESLRTHDRGRATARVSVTAF